MGEIINFLLVPITRRNQLVKNNYYEGDYEQQNTPTEADYTLFSGNL